MATGVWEPGKTASVVHVDRQLLERILTAVKEHGLSALDTLLDDDLANRGAAFMQLGAESWDTLADLPDADIEQLIRFFTLAEMQLPGWKSGKKSPVIPLVKLLKGRDAFPAELRKWIKANTDNRYLPNGAVL